MEQNILATACGRVQGVGFRYFVQRQATALGICGWVKNCEDGSVQMLLQGERAAVEKLLDILREGTVWIAVDQLLTEQGPLGSVSQRGKFLDSLLGPAASSAAPLPALLPKVCGKFIFLSDNVDIQTARRL